MLLLCFQINYVAKEKEEFRPKEICKQDQVETLLAANRLYTSLPITAAIEIKII